MTGDPWRNPNSLEGVNMNVRRIPAVSIALLAFTLNVGPACAVEPDPAVLSYKLPTDVNWSESVAYPGLKSALSTTAPGT